MVDHPGNPNDIITQLERLAKLHKEGFLTDAEFQNEKARILSSAPSPNAAVTPGQQVIRLLGPQNDRSDPIASEPYRHQEIGDGSDPEPSGKMEILPPNMSPMDRRFIVMAQTKQPIQKPGSQLSAMMKLLGLALVLFTICGVVLVAVTADHSEEITPIGSDAKSILKTAMNMKNNQYIHLTRIVYLKRREYTVRLFKDHLQMVPTEEWKKTGMPQAMGVVGPNGEGADGYPIAISEITSECLKIYNKYDGRNDGSTAQPIYEVYGSVCAHGEVLSGLLNSHLEVFSKASIDSAKAVGQCKTVGKFGGCTIDEATDLDLIMAK